MEKFGESDKSHRCLGEGFAFHSCGDTWNDGAPMSVESLRSFPERYADEIYKASARAARATTQFGCVLVDNRMTRVCRMGKLGLYQHFAVVITSCSLGWVADVLLFRRFVSMKNNGACI